MPCDTNVRDLECRRPPRRRAGRGRKREVPFRRADAWVARQPDSRWTRLTVRDGERGPLRVDAMTVRVRAKDERRIGPEERLVVMRTVEAKPRTEDSLSDAGGEVPLSESVRVRFTRHRIAEVFGAAKGEVGLGQYEVRGWVGWHHHMRLSFLALWFLILERIRVGGENPGGDRVAGAGDLHPAVAVAGPEPRAPSGSRRSSRGCCGGRRRHGSTSGTRRPASSHPAALDRTRVEQLRLRLNGDSPTSQMPIHPVRPSRNRRGDQLRPEEDGGNGWAISRTLIK